MLALPFLACYSGHLINGKYCRGGTYRDTACTASTIRCLASQSTPETNKLIYDNSLILLYRVLFILYAEARDLLPLQDNTRYRRIYSLDAIKKDVVSELQEGLILHNSGLTWTRLKELFKIINLGSPPLTVTTFNGGLFDPERHPFLEKYVAGDLNLCRAIDKLARVSHQFVDYRTWPSGI